MSDLKPSELTAEERAIVDHEASRFHRDWTAEARYKTAFDICKSLILARRALFAPPASEEKVETHICEFCHREFEEEAIRFGQSTLPTPASEEKVTCPNCDGDQRIGTHYVGWKKGGFTCQPAQPEPTPPSEIPEAMKTDAEVALDKMYARGNQENQKPAATEMTEAVRLVEQPTGYTRDGAFDVIARVCKFLLKHDAELGVYFPTAYELKEAVEFFAQPVTPPLAISEEMERVLYAAEKRSIQLDETMLGGARAVSIRAAIQKVRAQATAPKVVKMEKVREAMALLGTLLFEYQQHMSFRKERGAIFDAALAELDAHEGRKP